MAFRGPRFREGASLSAAVLTAEHETRAARLAWHRRAQHGAGVLSGLVPAIADGRLTLTPGLAVLDTGEALLATEAQSAPLPEALGRYEVSLAVGALVTGARHTRGGMLSLAPEGRAAAGLALCRLDVTHAGVVILVPAPDRAPVTAERVEAASGTVALNLGLDANNGRPRLAVGFGGARPTLTLDPTRGARMTRGLGFAAGNGAPGAARVEAAVFRHPIPAPEGPAPWSIRHVATEVDGSQSNDLQIEIPHPGKNGDPARFRLVFGNDQNGFAIDAGGGTAAWDGPEAGTRLSETSQVSFAPITPTPGDPALALAVSEAMLRGMTLALIHATVNTGVTGRVRIDGAPAPDIAVTFADHAPATTDADGRFFLAAIGWPGQLVSLGFVRDDVALGSQSAVVGASLQVFDFGEPGGGVI